MRPQWTSGQWSMEVPTLSIVIPTFNERENLPILFPRLADFASENGLAVEAIIVDDSSPDGTGAFAEDFAKNGGELLIRVLHRDGKLGLSSALFDGIRESRGDWVVTMDADDSHDTCQLTEMLKAARDGADVVIGSRYVPGARIVNWPLRRRILSWGATHLARMVFRMEVRDPMSGFALIRREVALKLSHLLNPLAYKFLLELLVRVRPETVTEVPITFKDRCNGKSKFTNNQILQYLYLVLALIREKGNSSVPSGT